MAKKGFKVDQESRDQFCVELKKAKLANDYSMVTRLRALILVSDGYTENRTAAKLDVGRASVQRWIRRFRSGGLKALARGPYHGAQPKLSEDQKHALACMIESGPESAGLDTGVWTAPIIVDLVKRRFNVSLSASQIRRILHKLGFSLQFPRRKLSQADKKLQANWIRNELPGIKKKSVRPMGS